MQRLSFRLVLPALLAVFAAGCEESATHAPEENFQGTYSEVRTQGVPLPAQVSSDFVYRLFLVADTLRLLPDGTGTQSWVFELRPNNPATHSLSISRGSRPVTYEARDGILELAFSCQNPPCGSVSGYMQGEMLVLGTYPGNVYRRVAR